MEENQWQSMLDTLTESGSGGPFFFIKKGKTRLRLIPEKGTKDKFFVETKRVFRGKERVRFILLGVIAGVSSRELSEEWKTKVSPIVVTKTTVQGILALLAEGYDLLGPEGHGITIVRSGEGLDTSYTVLPSPKPIPLPEEYKEAEMSLEEFSQVFYQNSLERDANRDTDAPAATPKKAEASGEDW